jgi:hypothetical protein
LTLFTITHLTIAPSYLLLSILPVFPTLFSN